MRNGVKQFDPNALLLPKPDLAGFTDTDVSEPGRCRIPAVEITNKGTLLAFYERRWAKGDLSPLITRAVLDSQFLIRCASSRMIKSQRVRSMARMSRSTCS